MARPAVRASGRSFPAAPALAIALAIAFAVAFLLPAGGSARAQAPVAPHRARSGLVVSQSERASKLGLQVLQEGGNAVDAAVATALALAVTHPAAGNLGGGGFLVALRPGEAARAFDFRERAPAAAHEDMFLDAEGRYDAERHHQSAIAVGVPGSVAGLWLAHRKLGRLPWHRLVEPAARLAREGFPISRALAESLRERWSRFRSSAAARRQFGRDGAPLRQGDRLAQPDLARTLERIRDRGREGFYGGETAELLEREMRRRGGLITRGDLSSYRAVERSPIHSTYRGLDLWSMPPPSSGGVALAEMLNTLEGYDLRALGLRGAREVHLLVEAMRRAFADRARWLGDPDHTEIPVARLCSSEHARELRASIDPARASPSRPESFVWPPSATETTHLSVVDADRMAVSLTTTLEQSYGAGIVVEGAGFLLNDEMGDFNPRRGMTDRRGHIGTPANLAGPGRRMLSSMSPTIVARHGRPFLVLGSPGGRTIINTVLLVLVNRIDHDLSLQAAVDAPRLHHQWLPDRILAERGCLSPDTRERLEAMGHRIEARKGPQGSVMAIEVRPDGTLEAGVDRRRADAGAAGY